MYEIYKISEDLYQIHSSYEQERAMEGTLLAILTYATYNLGFHITELELALLDMLDLDMDSASFDYKKRFVRVFNKYDRRTG